MCFTDIYHSTFDWPAPAEVAKGLERAGTSEAEMVDRLVVHHRNIGGVRSFYKHILKEINADQPKHDVFSQGKFYHLCKLLLLLLLFVAHRIISYHAVRLSELVIDEGDKICCFGC